MGNCLVCGGDIKNGVCSGCGMSREGNQNSQNVYANNDNKYYQNSSQSNYSSHGGFGVKKKKKSPVLILIGIFVLFFCVVAVMAFVNTISSSSSSNIEIVPEANNDFIIGSEEDEDFDFNFGSYEDEEEQVNIPSTGDEFSANLTSGAYIVGIHIPAGTYNIELLESDESYVWGYLVVNRDGRMLTYGSIDEEDYFEEITLIDGDGLNLDSDVPAHFYTENAQPMTMEKIENPLTQTILFDYYEDKIAGIDFPAGTYDIYILENDYGSVKIDIYNDFLSNQETYYSFYEEDVSLLEPIRHIEIPTGTRVSTDALIMELVPSEYDTLLNYFEFEENYMEANKVAEEKVIAENYQRQSEDKPMQTNGN